MTTCSFTDVNKPSLSVSKDNDANRDSTFTDTETVPGNAAAGKHHVLKASKETVQWGWLDPKEPPKLTIQSGDTVSVETWMHALDQIQPGVTMEKIVELRKANPGGGPLHIARRIGQRRLSRPADNR